MNPSTSSVDTLKPSATAANKTIPTPTASTTVTSSVAVNTPGPTSVTVNTSVPTPVTARTPGPTSVTANTPRPTSATTSTPGPTSVKASTSVPTPATASTPVTSSVTDNTNTSGPTSDKGNALLTTPATASTPVPIYTTVSRPVSTSVTANTTVPTSATSNTSVPTSVTAKKPVPAPITASTSVPTSATASTPVPTPVTVSTSVLTYVKTITPVPASLTSNTPVPTSVTASASVHTPVTASTSVPTSVTTNTPVPTSITVSTPVPTPVTITTLAPASVTTSTSVPASITAYTPVPTSVTTSTSVPTYVTASTSIPTFVTANTPVLAPVTVNTPVPASITASTSIPTPVTVSTSVPTPVTASTSVPASVTTSTSVPTPVTTNTPVPPSVIANTPVPTSVTTSTSVTTPVTTNTPVPASVTTSTSGPSSVTTRTSVPVSDTTSTSVPTPVTASTSVPASVTTSTPVPTSVTRSTSVPTPVTTNAPVPASVTTSTSVPSFVTVSTSVPTLATTNTPAAASVTASTSVPTSVAINVPVPSSADITQEETYYVRLVTLILKIAPRALRQLFDTYVYPGNLVNELNTQKSNLQKLKDRRVINKDQWNIMFPGHGNVKSEDFDITLMTLLLREICGVPEPKTGWNRLPPGTDQSVGADIARIKFYRNKITYNFTCSFTNNEFNNIWSDLSLAVIRVGGQGFTAEVNALSICALDPSYIDLHRELRQTLEDYKNEQITQWEKDDKSFHETRATKAVKEAVKESNFIIITGAPGSGKSSTVRHIALELRKETYSVHPVKTIKDIVGHWIPNIDQLFVLDDPFGLHCVNETEIEQWEKHKDKLEICFKYSNMKIMAAVRSQIAQDEKVAGIISELKNDISEVQLTADDISENYEHIEYLKGMGPNAVSLFKKAMLDGLEKVHEARVMVIGHQGVGKTTLTKGLIQDRTPREEITSTDGIHIYVGWSEIDLKTRKWRLGKQITDDNYRKLAQLLDNIGSETLDQDLGYCETEVETAADKSSSISIGDSSKEGLDSNRRASEETTPHNKPQETDSQEDKQKSDFERISDLSLSESTKSGQGESSKNNSEEMYAPEENKKPFNSDIGEGFSIEYFLKKALDAFAKEHSKHIAPVQIWDFGGQVVFYTTHQTFLSYRSLYLLVFDISKGLDGLVNDIDLIPGQTTIPESIDFLFFWVNSIIAYAAGTHPGFPKIIFIGTHLDQIPKEKREEKTQAILDDIRRHFEGHIGADHLIFDAELCFDMHDTESRGYDVLRNTILREAESQPFWGEKRPSSWLSLEETLTKLRLAGTQFLTFSQIEYLNNANNIYVMTEEELEAFLQYQHCKGNLLFFPERSLREFVVLNPICLVDALKTFITSQTFCKEDPIKAEMWTGTTRRGILHHDTISSLWQNDEHRIFQENRDSVLKVMERLDLITVPKQYTEYGENTSVDYFLVPSMILRALSTEEISSIIPIARSICFIICSKFNFLPPAIFHRLVASCLTLWPLLQHNGTNLLYSGFCGFRLDNFHRMFMQQKNYQILIHVTHTRDVKATNKLLCKVLKDYILMTMDRITEVYSQYHTKQKDTQVEKRESGMFEIQIPCCSQHLDCLLEKVGMCKHNAYGQRWLLDIEQDDECKSSIDGMRCSSDCKGLDEKIMKRKPTDQDICRLARFLVTDPTILGCALDVPEEELNYIQYRSRQDIYEINFRILIYWRDLGKSSFQTLMTALAEYTDENTHLMCKVNKVQSPYAIKGILRDMFFKRPTIEHLDALSNRLTPTRSFQLGIELGLALVDLEWFRDDCPNDSLQQCREMLYKWRRMCDEKQMTAVKATYGTLYAALYQIGAPASILHDLFQPDKAEQEDDEI